MPRRTKFAVLTLTIVTVAGCGVSAPTAAQPGASQRPVTGGAASPTGPTTSTSSGVSSVAPTASAPLGTVLGPVGSGRILFGVEQGDQGLIGIGYADAGGFHQIETEPDPTLGHAVWASPREIVFDSERTGARHLFRMNIDDGSVVQLTDGNAQEKPSVSSDGTRFVSDDYDPVTNQDLGLKIWSADGTKLTAVTPPGDPAGTSGATQGSFSPDGRMIAYVRDSDFSNDLGAIFVVDAKGGTPRRLTDGELIVSHPRWAPDGRSILFAQTAPDRSSSVLRIVDMKGGAPRTVIDPGPGSSVWDGDWSPDGKEIVYKLWDPKTGENPLMIAASDGTNPRAIWDGDSETPDWGP